VIRINASYNSVVLGIIDLNRKNMKVKIQIWVKYDHCLKKLNSKLKLDTKDLEAMPEVNHTADNGIRVVDFFAREVQGMAPGQSAVFYERE